MKKKEAVKKNVVTRFDIYNCGDDSMNEYTVEITRRRLGDFGNEVFTTRLYKVKVTRDLICGIPYNCTVEPLPVRLLKVYRVQNHFFLYPLFSLIRK